VGLSSALSRNRRYIDVSQRAFWLHSSVSRCDDSTARQIAKQVTRA
jgi:hypothetical protein